MRTRKIFVSRWYDGGGNFADNHTEKLLILRSCLKIFLRTFETGFRAGFCHFLRRIAVLFYDKNGGNMPEWCHKELLKKF